MSGRNAGDAKKERKKKDKKDGKDRNGKIETMRWSFDKLCQFVMNDKADDNQ